MLGGQPGDAYRRYIFSTAKGNIRNGFRAGSDEGPGRGLGPVGSEGYGSSQGGSEHLHAGSQLGSGAKGQQGGNRNADKRVQSVPQQIEQRKFVREELQQEEGGCACNYIPTGE